MTLTTPERPGQQRAPWFASWFDSIHYHKLYAYRDDTEAAGFIDELTRHLEPAKGAVVLDLGCGAGRHSRYLASKGYRVTGIDLAPSSIKQAKHFERPGLQFFQHDMRVPFAKNAIDYVFSFFTSFGYFEDPNEHLMVVRNIADSLKPGGRLVLDYLNVRYAEMFTTKRELRTVDGITYRLTRWSDASHFFKRIAIEDPHRKECGEYIEKVAKFGVQDFYRMFRACGLSIDAVWGDYRLSPYDTDTSPRMIIMAGKSTLTRESDVRPPLVTSRYTATATDTGGYMGKPPTGRAIRTSAMQMFRFANGKIVESWAARDDLGTLVQLEHLPPMGPPKDSAR